MELPGGRLNLGRLVSEQYECLYRYAFRLCGRAQDAEDLTQEAFCKAQLNSGQLREADRAKPWLFRILRNLFLQKIRGEKGRHYVNLEELDLLPERMPEPPTHVEPERLQEALNALPEDFRTPVILYYFEDFSYRDIADQMELPLGTVMSRLSRAKAFLRNQLEEPKVERAIAVRRRASHGL